MRTLMKRNGNLLSDMPSLFDDAFTRDLFGKPSLLIDSGSTIPSVNVMETEDDFQLEVAAPGLTRKDFKVELDNNMLIISSEKEEAEEQKERNYTRREFSYRSFKRIFTLPENMVDGDKISARYDNGVLYIIVPKKEEARSKPARTIKIA